MSRLRQPVPAAHVVVFLFSAVGFGVAQHWAGRLTSAQLLLALGLLEFVVQPVSTLIHELGHGVVACRLGGGPASIVVGRGPWLRFSVGQIRVNFSLLPGRGVLIRGICTYDPRNLSWRARALVLLGGPAATLLEWLAVVGLAVLSWPSAGTFGRNALVLSLIGLCGSLIVNLSPMTLKRGDREIAVGTDGTRARAALRLHREGAPPQPPQPVPQQPARPSSSTLPQLERQRDIARAQTSVPPPSSS